MKVKDDLKEIFYRFVPQTTVPLISYLRHTSIGPDDMPAHIKRSLLLTHLSIPISSGQLLLGR
ncbi:MAG: hypothetical protein CML56_00985 [Rhodobacteraceae bacterium]|nr:hypothetical protein [Paracoccaceae bacterium]